MRVSVLLPIFFLLALSGLLPGGVCQPTQDENARVRAALGSGAMPVFNAYFPTQPNPAPSPTLNYSWLTTDPADSASVAAWHTGVASLNGGAQSFIDVTTTTGPNTCNVALPSIIGGAGSGSGATQGWSIDIVVKLTISSGGWAKLIDFGDGQTGAGQSPTDFTITWDGNDNNENGRMEGLAVQNINNASRTQYSFGVVPIIKPVIGQWYHLALVMQAVNVSANSATWFMYVNGQLLPYSATLQAGTSLTAFQGANLPLPVPRPASYIGKSNYGDPDLYANFDAVRLYDYALSATQVTALAAAYNLNTGVTIPQNSDSKTLPTTAETNYWQNAEIPRAPVLNAVFPADPTSAIGTAPLYTWAASDSADSAAVQAQHQGVIKLDGSLNSFVDLTTPTGGNSIGQVMGVFGGPGSGSGAAQGWTVELVVKLSQAQSYAKLLSIGNGGYLDVLFIGWDYYAQNLYLEQYANINGNLPGVVVQADVYPVLNISSTSYQFGQWLHMAVVLQPTSLALYTGVISVYLNGQLAAQSSDPALTNYPLPTYRDQTYIGASDYNDPNAIATYDAVRVYDQALSQRQVQLMARQYGLFNGTLVPGSNNTGGSSGSSGSNNSGGGSSSSSGISGGGIAGAVIGSVVGAVLICAVLFYVLSRRGGSSKPLRSPTNAGAGGKGATYGDVEQSSTSPRETELA